MDKKCAPDCGPDCPPCPDCVTEMGFSEAVAKTLKDAKVDAGLLWSAIHTKGATAVAALEAVFKTIFGK